MSVGATYSPPASPTVSLNEDAAWQFALNPSGSPQSTSYSDASWTAVTLPHTWDASATNDPTGDGWYRKTINIPASMVGDEIYLQFLGASLTATVYVDGVAVGAHAGGWESFDIDVTPEMTAGNHLIAVDVNNNTNADVLPAGGGDYIKEGGLYRDVSLVAESKTHVALTEPVPASDPSGSDLAGSGVYFSNSTVVTGATSASIQVDTVLDNLAASAEAVTVTSYLVQSNGVIAAQSTTSQSLAAGQTDVTVNQSGVVANPHLWAGRADPYLYDLYVEVRDASSGQLLDLNHQQVGIRSYSVSPNNGFELNGQPYALVGVDLQQDSGAPGLNGGPAGWAETDAQQEQDINAVLQLGATMIRTAHYTRDPAFYDYCDQTGLIVTTELGLNDVVTTTTTANGTTVVSPAFMDNAEDQLTEMIRQNYNHPSIITWGLFNEIESNPANAELVESLDTLAHNLDPTRDTVAESNSGTATDALNDTTNLTALHIYDGWYGYGPDTMLSTLDAYHEANPTDPIGVSEFGAGGDPSQFTSNVEIPPSTTTTYNPENQQTQIEEEQWAEISSCTYLYEDLVWSMYDFPDATSSSSSNGFGENDKGLISRDRQTYSDIYYFYEANFNDPTSSRGYATTPVVYISDHDWTERTGSASVAVTVFSNIGAPTLAINGGDSVLMSPQVLNGIPIPDAYTATVTLSSGSNTLVATASLNGTTTTNSVTWAYTPPATPGTGAIKINFQPADSGPTATGYLIDTGQVFGPQPDGATYGWDVSNTANAYRRDISSDPRYDTLIEMEQNGSYYWQYALPNGNYDVYIAAGDPASADSVQNLNVNGLPVFDTAGMVNSDAYTVAVTVTNGLLTIAPGTDSVNASLQFVEITPVGSITGTVTSTTGAPVAGMTVYLDTNNNAVPDPGELTAITNSQGVYDFSGVLAGSYIVRQELTSAYVQAEPTNNYGNHVTLSAGGSVNNQNFTDTVTPTGSVSGTVTANGAGVAGITVYLDANNNSTLDPGELSTVTNSAGFYDFTSVLPGAYIVRQVLPASYTQTTPYENYGNHVTVTGGSSTTNQNFTDAPVATASVSGTVTANGAGLANVTVYLDANNNDQLDLGELTAITDSDGNYLFTSVPPGTYVVRQVLPATYAQLTPADNYGDHVTLAAGGSAGGQDFTDAALATGSISGTITANGAGVANITVYLDINNDGMFQSSEPYAVTDASGNYLISDVAAGTYTVRQVLPADYSQVSPAEDYGNHATVTAGAAVTGQDFVDAPVATGGISGTVTANGAGVANLTLYLDANNNGAYDTGEVTAVTDSNGNYSFTGLPAGAYIVRQELPAGYSQITPAGNYGNHPNVTAGATVTGQDFTDDPPVTTGSVSGSITSNGVGVANITVYLDANNNSILDPGELTAVSDANGNYSFANVPPGAYIVRQELPAGDTQITPYENYGNHVTVTASGNVSGQDFTDVVPAATGSVSGSITANGVGVPSITVYLDANNNSVLDPGELTAVSDANGNYSFTNVPPGAYIVRQVLPAGDSQITPYENYGNHVTVTAGGSVSGQDFTDVVPAAIGTVSGSITANGIGVANITVYLDTNNNSILDPGELTAVTDSSGNYSFTNVPPGAYIVRQVLPATYTQVTPYENYGNHITVVAGASVTAQDFTDAPTGGDITGTVFSDANGNGIQDAGEAGLSGWELYLDLSNSDSFLSGDPTATTDANGDYLFSDLAPGNYIVRVMPVSNYAQTTPTNNYGQHVTLAAGQTVSGASFGEQPIS